MIEINNLSITHKKRRIIKNLNLKVLPNKINCIIGASGAGKTTLCTYLMHMLNYEYDITGEVFFNNQKTTIAQINTQLKTKMILQSVVLNPYQTITTQLQYLNANHANVLQWMQQLSLPIDILHKLPGEMSDGEKQRVYIMFSCIHNPGFLIADEATASFGMHSIHAFTKAISRPEYSLIVTHDISLALKLGNIISVMYDGEIIENCEAQNIKNSKNDYVQKIINTKIKRIKNTILQNKTILQYSNIKFTNREDTFPKIENIDILENSVTSIIGNSGTGKSTIVHAIFNRMYTGYIRYKGKEISEIPEVHKNIQIVHQNSHTSLPPNMTIEEILHEIKIIHNINNNTANDKIALLMQKFNLNSQILAQYPHSLSGGEKKRIAIIRSYIIDPQIMIFDEITSSLDQINKYNIIETLLALQGTKTYIFIDHNLQILYEISDEIIGLQDNKIMKVLSSKVSNAHLS